MRPGRSDLAPVALGPKCSSPQFGQPIFSLAPTASVYIMT